VDDLARVFVPMVLIGDVHIGTGVDVVTDLQVEVAHDVAAPADHAPVPDPDHWIGDHLLAGHHAGRNAHMGADKRVPPDGNPLLTEDRPGRKGQTTPLAEGPEPGRQRVAGAGGAIFGQPLPSGMNGRMEPTALRPGGGREARIGSGHFSTLSDRSPLGPLGDGPANSR
jgi:hypothetical protein